MTTKPTQPYHNGLDLKRCPTRDLAIWYNVLSDSIQGYRDMGGMAAAIYLVGIERDKVDAALSYRGAWL